MRLLWFLYPRLKRFLKPPGTGVVGIDYPPDPDMVARVRSAVWDVLMIWQIWRETPEGKWKRKRPPFAVEIAAERNGVEDVEVSPERSRF